MIQGALFLKNIDGDEIFVKGLLSGGIRVKIFSEMHKIEIFLNLIKNF